MVGLQTLDLAIGVRVPASQPNIFPALGFCFFVTSIFVGKYVSSNLTTSAFKQSLTAQAVAPQWARAAWGPPRAAWGASRA
jgi:hypothetical protein